MRSLRALRLAAAAWSAGSGAAKRAGSVLRPAAVRRLTRGDSRINDPGRGTIADALRQLHDLPVPTEFTLAPLAPFTRLAQRIHAATLSTVDRSWLRDHLTELLHRYATLIEGIPRRVIHGDAWVGNVVTTDGGHTVLLDLERCSVGPPEWDLVSTAIKHTSFAWVPTQDYQDFCRRYGHDVTTWPGFELLRDIRELRMTYYLAQHATEHPCARSEAELRVACLRGNHGPRPWNWTPAP